MCFFVEPWSLKRGLALRQSAQTCQEPFGSFVIICLSVRIFIARVESIWDFDAISDIANLFRRALRQRLDRTGSDLLLDHNSCF